MRANRIPCRQVGISRKPQQCRFLPRFGYFYPRLELLEDRVQPGETFFSGFWGFGLFGLDSSFADRSTESDFTLRESQTTLREPQVMEGSLSMISLFSSERGHDNPPEDGRTSVSPGKWTDGGNAGTEAANDILALETAQKVANRPFASLSYFGQKPASAFTMAADGELVESRISSTALADNFFPLKRAEPEPASFAGLAIFSSVSKPSGNLFFDPSSGVVIIRGQLGGNTVRESITQDGFLELTVDSRQYSSNPDSAVFERDLLGATASTVAGIHYENGGGHDTLTLGSQNLAGSFTVSAPGAEVHTQDIGVGGQLAIEADRITVSGALHGREVGLSATGLISVETAGSLVAAHGNNGGRIDVNADIFVTTGQLHADGVNAGQVFVHARNMLNAGQITADGNNGAVGIAFTGSYIDTTTARTSSGHVTITGSTSGRLYSSGTHQATGLVGGTIDLLGREVVLNGATVDASGAKGGGLVRVGGDFQGKNALVVNAQTVTVTGAATIRADALHWGDGGRVVIWSDHETVIDGTVSARGGRDAGDGGFIEVSGKGNLNHGGSADAGAHHGKTGTLLLDPKNIIISEAPAGVFPQFDLIDPHPTSVGAFGVADSILNNGNVVIVNTKDDFGGDNAGSVYLFNGLTGALISALVGSHANDRLGFAPGDSSITLLSSGNYLVLSENWYSNRGALTWGNSTLGVNGILSDANSLVGDNPNDFVGGPVLLPNGNYVVQSPNWHSGRGAVTWGDSNLGVHGVVSETNSLVGSNPNDLVGNGNTITFLRNGNFVIASQYWNNGRGAVTWGSGTMGITGQVSQANSLVGTNTDDRLGSCDGLQCIFALNNGSYLVRFPRWNSGRGAVTWGNGTTGVSGTISEANSLVGSAPGDSVGSGEIVGLTNGSYLVPTVSWNENRGAVTFGPGSTGVSGTISEANSLVGTHPNDLVGTNGFPGAVTLLTNGNFVVSSSFWNSNRGAVTFGNATTGVSGALSEVNSLVGTNPNDRVGGTPDGSSSVLPLTNGNYVVRSYAWGNSSGAATFGIGTRGISGTISETNSLIGSNPSDDVATEITPLRNGNYVVQSPGWNSSRGAATWGDGSKGVTGNVSDTNSLVGSRPNDRVSATFGSNRGVVPLSNGNYVVASPYWNASRGAVTLMDGSQAVGETVSESNSLVGNNPNDLVSHTTDNTPGVIPLSNGNYVIRSPFWNGNRGAVTWASGSSQTSGIVSNTNSLVGSNTNDWIAGPMDGIPHIIVLSNDSYVVQSYQWNNMRGAVTWGDGSRGVAGIVSDVNSLVGTNPNDIVGVAVTPLTNDNFVVISTFWNSNRGAVTWGNGAIGLSGSVSEANSLVGSNANDCVAGVIDSGYCFYLPITRLRNGNYVVQSTSWNGRRGAVTWGSGTTGAHGIVSEGNSLIGSNPNDCIGGVFFGGSCIYSMIGLLNGDYIVQSRSWNANRGAATWINGTTGQPLDGHGFITQQNSLVGGTATSRLVQVELDSNRRWFVAAFYSAGHSGRVTAALTDPNQFAFLRGQSETVALTPGFLTGTLNTGTDVVLQASNDITIDDPIIVNANGKGGALTLQAGRSILVNANITTDNGPLTLIANDTLANGVVDSQREPGNASIIMAPGTRLDTGTGPLTMELRNGAGRTNTSSRAINLQTITAGSVTVVNNGPSSGSDVRLASVTTTGSQTYSNPNGITTVTGNITAADDSITFTDSVAVNDSVTVDAGSSTVNFAGTGTQTLHTGIGSHFGNVVHNGTGTLQLTSALTVGGGFTATSGAVEIPTANTGLVSVAGSVAFSAAATEIIHLDGMETSQVMARGPIDLGGSTLNLVFDSDPTIGIPFTLLSTTDPSPIKNTFAGLDEGAIFTQGGFQFQITYMGGNTGNNVVLMRVA